MTHKKSLLLFVTGALLASTLLSGCAQPLPAKGQPALTPKPEAAQETVERFYHWYLGYPGNVVAEEAYRASEYLTPQAVEQVDQIISSFTMGGYDPFLCAQDVPERVEVVDVTVTDDAAQVVAHGVWNAGSRSDIHLTLRPVDGAWQIDHIACPVTEAEAPTGAPPEATEPPPIQEMRFQTVEIPQVGLSFEVPADWQRLEPEWVWAPSPGSAVHLGVNGVELEPPMEPEAVLLPNHAQILDSEPIHLSWGEGRRFLLERYGPAAESEGEERKAPVEAVELHIVSIIEQRDDSLALNLYASAPTMEDLAQIEPLFQHVWGTATMAPGDVAPAGEDAGTEWISLQDDAFGFALRYPATWTLKDLPTHGPGVPEDFPIQRVTMLFPLSMAQTLEGPPDPTGPPAVPPLYLEVCVGPEEQFRRAYAETGESETTVLNGLEVTVGRDTIPQGTIIRYVFRHPENEELRVIFQDALSGVPERVEGREDAARIAQEILRTFQFTR
jgi:hypothetical protein